MNKRKTSNFIITVSFRHLATLVLLFSILHAKTEEATDSRRSERFHLSIISSKTRYAEGAEIILSLRLENRTRQNAKIQINHPRTSVAINHNGAPVDDAQGKSVFRIQAASSDIEIRFGEADGWLVFSQKPASLQPGSYKATFRVYINESPDNNELKEKVPNVFVEASAEFKVVPSTQTLGSNANPLDDLTVRLTDNRNVEDRRSEPLALRLNVVNTGLEPWFYEQQPIHHGIEFEVIDSKGRVFGRNKKGGALADSSPERYNRYSGPGPRSIDFLPSGTEDLGSFKLDDYTLLAPDSAYTVRATWKGKAYRSSKDREEGKNAIPFEIRSDSISVRTPRN